MRLVRPLLRRIRNLSRRQKIANCSILAIGLLALFGTHLLPASTNRIEMNDLTVAADKDPGITIKDLRPDACRAVGQDLDVTNLISGGASIAGTAANDMIFADSTTTDIDGSDGDDCIVAGVNTTHVDGGLGNNVCVVPAVYDDTRVTNCTIVHET